MDSNLKIFDKNSFNILKIGCDKVSHLDWNSPDYINAITSMDFIKTFSIEPQTFFDKIYELLDIEKFKENTHLVTEYIAEEPNYIYEMIYMDSTFNKENLQLNELASILHLKGEAIYGNAIITKTHVPSLTKEISFSNMDSSELNRMIRNRGYTKVMLWEDNIWRQEEMFGETEKIMKKFFEDEYYKKIEIGFLKHNINICYTTSEYGKEDVLGKLVKGKFEKIAVYTMITDDIRGSLTKDELEKIIKLSNYLEPPYRPEDKWFEEETDEHGRKIIKNKFRILDNVYNDFKLN